MIQKKQKTHVFIDALPFHLRSNHTDLACLRKLSELVLFDPSINLYYPSGKIHATIENIRYLGEVLRHRVSPLRRVYLNNAFLGKLDRRSLNKNKADVVYSHSNFPVNAGNVPVIWRNTILDPEMRMYNGLKESQLLWEIRQKRICFEKAALIHVSTDAEVVRLSEQFPEFASKYISLPYFLPYLKEASSADEIIAKNKSEIIEITFIGRHAIRKGLDLLLKALSMIDVQFDRKVLINIVSDLSDGKLQIPDWANLIHYRSASRLQVEELLKRSAVFVMPSKMESYGLVYIEAMAQGCVPVVPDWEVQRELVDYGNAGIPVPLNPNALADVIRRLIVDAEWRLGLALSAVSRFDLMYKAPVVAKKYIEVMRKFSRE